MKVAKVRDAVLGNLREGSPVQIKKGDESSRQRAPPEQLVKIKNEVRERGPTNARGATMNYVAQVESLVD